MTHPADKASEPVQFLEGAVHPRPGTGCDPEQVRQLLRARGFLAAVGRDEPDALLTAAGFGPEDTDVRLCVAVDAHHRVLQHGPDGPVPGPPLAEFAAELATITSCDVDVHDEFHAGYAAEEVADDDAEEAGLTFVDVDEPDPALDVVLCRASVDMLPFLARDTDSGLTAYAHDGWLIVRFHEVSPDLHNHGWLARETPAVALSEFGGARYLSVLVGRGILPGQATLTRLTMLAPTFTPDEVPMGRPLLEKLANPHFRPESQLSLLLAEAPFAHLDAASVAEAVQSPGDDWFARVLTALELPVEAAHVFAGATLTDSVEIQPAGLWSTMRNAIRQSSENPADGGGRGFMRFLGNTARRPWLMLTTVVPETLIGLLLLNWMLGAADRPWWLIALGVVGVLLLLDAAIDLIVLVRRLRKRRR